MNRLSQAKPHVNNLSDGAFLLLAATPPPPSYEQVLRNIFRWQTVGLYRTDLSGNPLHPFARAAVAAAGQRCVGCIDSRQRKVLASAFGRAMEAGTQWSQQLSLRISDGSARVIHVVIAPLLDENGAAVGYQGCHIDVTAQAEAQRETASAEDRLRLAVEAAELGIWDYDVVGNALYVSPFCYEMLGYRGGQAQTCLGEWINILHPQHLESARRIVDDCIEGRIENFEVELRLKTDEGKWRWFRCTGKAAARDASGRALRLAGTMLDINQSKMMEHLLRMEHDLLDLITATSPVGILFIEPDGNTAFANPRAERILGLTKEQMLARGGHPAVAGMTSLEAILDADAEQSLEEVLKLGICLQNACFSFTRPDRSGAVLSISTAPFLDKASKVSGTVVTLEDVTEQKRREQEILDNDRLLRETQMIAQLGSYVLDLARDKWECSSKLQDILGIDKGYPKTMQGHFDIVHEEYRDRFVDHYRSAIAHARRFEMEYKIKRHHDGEERWVTESGELTGDGTGRKLRMIGTIRDITERKAAEEAIRNLNNELDRRVVERTSQLVAAKKEIESFSYSVSHDLRAPLRHINSYSSILVEEHGDALPEEARYYLDRICTASARMGKQIDDLLALTRVGRAVMKRTTFNISHLAAEVVDMLQDDETPNAAEFVVQPGIKANGDSVLVRLVLQNLLGNSVKYSSRSTEPRIEFGQAQVAGIPAFFVRDNGVGFDMAYVEKLFQPFQRLHGSEFEGTGIGLATVRRIIERHGGSIWAEGRENEGATFFFTLSQSRKA